MVDKVQKKMTVSLSPVLSSEPYSIELFYGRLIEGYAGQTTLQTAICFERCSEGYA
jgi:hypothetical protein